MNGIVIHPLMAQAIADEIGATKRQVQIWTDAGVLCCMPETDRKGRGRQRLYNTGEVAFGALAARMANLNMPIGHLQRWMRLVREVWDEGSSDGTPPSEYRAALRGEFESWLVFKNEERTRINYGWLLKRDELEKFMAEESAMVVINVARTIKDVRRYSANRARLKK